MGGGGGGGGSLKGHHEKAMQYFNRALKLDRHYLSAWTLMGHEYVEIKNVPMAIGACARRLTRVLAVGQLHHPQVHHA